MPLQLVLADRHGARALRRARSFVLLLARRFLFGAEVEGVFTLFALQFFLTGIMLFGVGLMGEYVGRIQQEVRQPPALPDQRGAREESAQRPMA